MLFLLHGIEHRKIHLEYFPGEQELYLNGEPVFNLSFGPKEEDECWEFLDEIETARENLKAGLTCSQCYARYQKWARVAPLLMHDRQPGFRQFVGDSCSKSVGGL